MIQLTKDQSNTIALTLSELANESLPNNWLFRFQLVQSKTTYEYLGFLVADSNSERYNQFTLVEPDDFNFRSKGDYLYEVYQMPDTDDTDFTRGTLVENGMMRLSDAVVVTPTFTPNTEANIYDSTSI